MKKETLLPYDLQFFADEATDNPEAEGEPESKDAEGEPEESKDKPDDSQPSIQDLLVENARLKREKDKNASEAAEWKKKFRATQSEKERADEQKAEAEAAKEQRLEQLEREVKVRDLVENFMELGYAKDLAKQAAEAQVDGDTDLLLKIQKSVSEAQKKAWEADFLKNRPEINAGAGQSETVTAERFAAMDLQEKTKLKREHPEEYARLMGKTPN